MKEETCEGVRVWPGVDDERSTTLQQQQQSVSNSHSEIEATGHNDQLQFLSATGRYNHYPCLRWTLHPHLTAVNISIWFPPYSTISARRRFIHRSEQSIHDLSNPSLHVYHLFTKARAYWPVSKFGSLPNRRKHGGAYYDLETDLSHRFVRFNFWQKRATFLRCSLRMGVEEIEKVDFGKEDIV